MQSKFQKNFYKWTGRTIAPLFLFTQLFIACPGFAAGQNGITVTGTPVNTSTDTNVFVVSSNPGAAATNAQDLITLNFEETDVRTVLLYLAEITGDTILPDKSVRGNVTIINPKPVTPEAAKQIIFSILEMQGFTIVRYDDYVKIVKSGTAKTRPIKTLQPPKGDKEMDSEDIIRTQVFYPKHVSPEDVQKFITPLLTSGAGQIVINKPTGAVLIIDTGANIKRLMNIIDLIDRIIEGGQIDIKMVPLEYADEQEMSTMLNTIFNAPALKDPNAQKVTVDGSPVSTGGKSDSASAAVLKAVKKAGAELTLNGEIGTKATFIADQRLHSLIVIAAKRMFPIITHIIEKLDVPSTEKDDTIHIYPLQHVKAEDITDTLNDIFSERSSRTSRSSTRPSLRDRDNRSSSSRSGLSRSRPPTRKTTRRPSSSTSKGSGLSHLAGKVDVLYDEPSNSLIIITSPKYYETVKRIIERLDQRTPQAWIQAMIVEVSRNKDFNFGVGWKKIMKSPGGSKAGLFQALDTTLGPAFDAAKQEIKPASLEGFAFAYGDRDKYGNFDPYMTLQTAEGVKDINVLSTPSVLAANNKEASIKVGEQFPIARYSRGESGTTRDFSYEYTDITIELNVIPRINRHREVALEVDVDVKDNGGSAYPTDPTAPPIILQRSSKTEVVVQDGQTLVIGGLIKDDFNSTVQKIPLLGDIPIVKHAFRTYKDVKRKIELLIFITPYVVANDSEGGALTKTVRSRYRGADGFIDNRDRNLLYDDLNSTKDQVTIYDDWRTFEKKIEFTENYFNPKAAEEAAKKRAEDGDSRYFYHFPHVQDKEPYEGEIIIPSEFDNDVKVSPDAVNPPKSESNNKQDTENNSSDSSADKKPLSSIIERERLLVNSAKSAN